MSKFDEILNSSNPSDALLGEQIDALSNGWVRSNIHYVDLDNNFADGYESYEYYNQALNRVCVVFNGVSKKEIAAGTTLAIGDLSSDKLIPKGTMRAYLFSSTGYELRFSKNNTNKAVALSVNTKNLPSGTSVSFQIEWQLF